jgi:hypothetical protein
VLILQSTRVAAGCAIYRVFSLLEDTYEDTFPHCVWRALVDEIFSVYLRTAVSAAKYVRQYYVEPCLYIAIFLY